MEYAKIEAKICVELICMIKAMLLLFMTERANYYS